MQYIGAILSYIYRDRQHCKMHVHAFYIQTLHIQTVYIQDIVYTDIINTLQFDLG